MFETIWMMNKGNLNWFKQFQDSLGWFPRSGTFILPSEDCEVRNREGWLRKWNKQMAVTIELLIGVSWRKNARGYLDLQRTKWTFFFWAHIKHDQALIQLVDGDSNMRIPSKPVYFVTYTGYINQYWGLWSSIYTIQWAEPPSSRNEESTVSSMVLVTLILYEETSQTVPVSRHLMLEAALQKWITLANSKIQVHAETWESE